MKKQVLLGMLVLVNCAYGMDTKPLVGKRIIPFVKQPTALQMLHLWTLKRIISVRTDDSPTPIIFGWSGSIEGEQRLLNSRGPEVECLIEEYKILTICLMKEARMQMVKRIFNDLSRDPGSH